MTPGRSRHSIAGMALSISYYTGADTSTNLCYGGQISRASVVLTSTSAACGVVPSGAVVARVKAGEDCYVSNNGSDASDTNGEYLEAGEFCDMQVPNGGAQFMARTV